MEEFDALKKVVGKAVEGVEEVESSKKALKKFGKIPFYELISQDGPEHKKEFVISAKLNGHIYGRGWGLSKKNAEQMAAKEALEKLQT